MTTKTRSPAHPLRAAALAGALLVPAAALAPAALAQDHGGGPSPEEMLKKIVEIESLMRQAETALARSTADRAARDAEDRLEKLLDEKSRAQAGKSAEQLRRDAAGGSAEARATLDRLLGESRAEAGRAADRVGELLEEKSRQAAGKSAAELQKLAEGGSAEAQEQLRRLTEEAQREAASATEGIRKLLEETKASGQGASKGIEWILVHGTRRGGTRSSQSGGEEPQRGGPDERDPKKEEPKPGEKPKDGEEGKDPKEKGEKPPESRREKPPKPDFEQWFAELPPQVRKAYETEDWDSIPPRWRELLRDWAKRYAEELDAQPEERR